MSQVTHRSPTLSPYGRSAAHPLPSAASWLFAGVVAAGLGLGALAVLVLLLWITSPYPDSGAGGALHIAADLWLLGHGSRLIRTETLSGVPAPVALTPLLLVVMPARLLYRACLQALGDGEERGARPGGNGAGEQPGVLAPIGWVATGYLLAGASAVVFASAGPVRVDVPSAVLRLPLFVACVAGVAAWVGTARTVRAEAPADGPAGVPSLLPLPPRLEEALALAHRLRPLRAAAFGTAVLCGGGLLLTLGSVCWHLDAVQASFPQLVGAWQGRFAALLLAVALLPNAVVWAMAYGLGPGFLLGTGTVVGPLSAGGTSGLPPFPLLAALPAEGADGPAAWLAAGTVPLAAGVTLGCCVACAAVPVPGSRKGAVGWRSTAAAAGLAACACGAVVALLASCAGGALGTHAMASFGPDWRFTGLAAVAWAALAGAPSAVAVRAWRLRDRGPDGDWYATGARHARWAALKTASGGLMPDFEPRRD